MSGRNWAEECRALSERACSVATSCSCSAVIDMHEGLLRSMWEFDVALLGDDGTKAVFTRAINLAQDICPSLKHIQVSKSGLDFGPLSEYLAKTGCGPAEVHRDLLYLCKVIFDVESDIVGAPLIEPKLHRLKRSPQGR